MAALSLSGDWQDFSDLSYLHGLVAGFLLGRPQACNSTEQLGQVMARYADRLLTLVNKRPNQIDYDQLNELLSLIEAETKAAHQESSGSP